MDYLYYLLAMFAIALIILAIKRQSDRAHRSDDHLALAEKARRRREREKAARKAWESAPLTDHGQILKRELSKVPTPWGWPRHDESGLPESYRAEKGTVRLRRGHSLRHWADVLIREKRTVSDEAYLKRREAALRALLEDRYGHPIEASTLRYRKVKAPLLRDPSAPHDQMDNFPSGKAERILAGLSGTPRNTEAGRRAGQNLGKVRKPWGW